MKVVIAHPSKQHSFQTAIAVKNNGMLDKYITTIYHKPKSFTTILTSLLKGTNKKKSLNRRCESLDDSEVIQYCELLSLLRTTLSKIPLLDKIDVRSFFFKRFFKKVTNYAIKNNVDAIIVFDALAKQYLDRIKKKAPHIKIIMDVTICTHSFMKNTFLKDMESYNHKGLYAEEPHMWNDKHINYLKESFEAVDHFFVPSNIVEESVLYCGVDAKKIIKIPYGVDINSFTYKQKISVQLPLRLLFVGSVTYRKGIHHLLKVISDFSANEVVLNLAGAIRPDNEFYKEYNNKENINFLGFVTRDRITQEFQDAHYFILPSLGEGLALVTLESLATGTPVICSEMTGGNDAIEDKENGILIKAGDEESIKEAILWAIENKDKLPQMSENARESSLNYSWDIYGEHIAKTLNEILKK